MIEWLDENEFQKLGNKKRDSIGKIYSISDSQNRLTISKTATQEEDWINLLKLNRW